MLSIETCQRILNENAPEGVRYTVEETEQLRGVLYVIARIHLETLKPDAQEESDHLQPRLYKRAS